MKTTSTYEQGKLIIAISGHIDSSEAKQLQEELHAATCDYEEDELEELILDLADVTYISSLGLRCILQQKQQHASLSVINCSAEVYGVFKMAGFTRFISIEKALTQVSIDGLQRVDGLTDTYQLTDETMIKVFPPDTTSEEVERELLLSRELFVMGVPTVMTFEKVRVGQQYGLVYENLTLKDIDAKSLGTMMRQLHEHTVEPGGMIPSAIDKERELIEQRAEELGEEATSKLKHLLTLLPDGSALLQRNFPSQKVGYHDGKPIMVELSGVSYGNPIIDLSHLYCSLPEEKRGEYFDEFMHSYYDTESAETIASQRQVITALAIAQDIRNLSRWDEILSKLHFKMDFAEEIRKLERKRFYLDCDVNVNWVANTLGTNRHYVSDYFNNVLHVSFNDYINNLRLEYAVELLKAGRVTQSQIAYTVGFNNDHTFRRLFKEKYGCTPSQYGKGE